jgi:hypothetical protein
MAEEIPTQLAILARFAVDAYLMPGRQTGRLMMISELAPDHPADDSWSNTV